MTNSLAHLEPTFHEILSEAIPKDAYARKEALMDVPGHWVEQLGKLLGDDAGTCLFREGKADRWGYVYALDIHLQARDGTRSTLTMNLDLGRCDCPTPLLVSITPPGKDIDKRPRLVDLRAAIAKAPATPMPEVAAAHEIGRIAPGIPCIPVGDGTVRLGTAAEPVRTGRELAQAIRVADARKVTLACRFDGAAMDAVRRMGFRESGKWMVRDALGTKLADRDDQVARRRGVEAARALPNDERIDGRVPDAARIGEVEGAVSYLRANTGRHARSLEGVFVDVLQVARVGGTAHRQAAQMRSLTN